MAILEYYKKERVKFLDQCIQCGVCADNCPILPYTDLKEPAPKIQEAVFDSVENGTFNHLAYTKAFACMECFRCTTDVCPQDLNPMLINELIKGVFISQGMAPSHFSDSQGAESPQRIIARVQVSENEYQRITTTSPKQEVEYVFFPGCNVYFQPEKILNALDIMDYIGDSYAFLPGLDNCCGDNQLFFGLQQQGSLTADKLIAKLCGYNPKAIILWCPTCHCRFHKYIASSTDVQFKVISFPQYLAGNIKKLPLAEDSADKILTLHEPCKSAYTGTDPDGPRQVLSQLPNVELKEMEHHGANTLCCGSGAACWFPDSCSQIQSYRLREAKQTGAKQMVTICHYCNQTFASKATGLDIEVVNYVNLIAELMGIHRQDKYKKYAHWNDLELILNDIGSNIEDTPFEREKIIATLRSLFVK
ncbi:(Fe-S)-binding protein [Desulforhopalus singaporensis]|uniref:Fe-S oxidoreductase n=1 Tax=Desulforhopalus singaporensis TaxID=91360 RepID=A0A1H0URX3_9BACT|nr:(Fe-S)-binding protein [Desulforhopalus singaporensis]SDP68904.1 Fe-S oxidoreductase [Desulforhopalus singaporensis]